MKDSCLNFFYEIVYISIKIKRNWNLKRIRQDLKMTNSS